MLILNRTGKTCGYGKDVYILLEIFYDLQSVIQ